MSAIVAYSASPTSTRRHGHTHYGAPNSSFLYSQPSLNIVTASPSSIEDLYARGSYLPSVSSAWNTQYQQESAAPSVSPPLPPLDFPSSSRPIHGGSSTPHNLEVYPTQYASQHVPYGASSSPAYSHSFHTPSTSLAVSSAHARASSSSENCHYTPVTPAPMTSASTKLAATPKSGCTWRTGLHYALCQVDHSSLDTVEPADPSTVATTPRLATPFVSPPSLHQVTKLEEKDPVLTIEVTGVPSEHVSQAMLSEIPLRAVHATPEMMKMMKIFHVDEFVAHNGIIRAASKPSSGSVEIGPLKEPPVLIEWQVQLIVPLIAEDEAAIHDEETYGAESQVDSMRKCSPSSPSRVETLAARCDSPPTSPASACSSCHAFNSMYYSFVIDNDGYDTSSSDHYPPENGSPPAGFPYSSRPTFPVVVAPNQLEYGRSVRGGQLEIGDSDMEWPTRGRENLPSDEGSFLAFSPRRPTFAL